MYNTHVNITHWEESIVLLTVWTIPTIAASIWNIGVGVTKPAVNTYWKFVPAEKHNKILNCTSVSAHKYKIGHLHISFKLMAMV